MKSSRMVMLVSLLALSATPVWAQFGLYGAPEMLNLSPANQAGASYGNQAMPVSYPAQPVPVASPLGQYAGRSVYSQTGATSAAVPTEPAPPPVTVLPLDPSGSCAYGDYASCGADGGCGMGQAVCDFERAACRSCCPWYGSVSGLIMSRNNANRLWTSYEWGNDSNQIENTQFGMEWRAGGEIRFGRRFCCNTWAVEATYWTLDAFEGSRVTTNPAGVATPLTVGNVYFGGYAGTEWFDGAQEHRLRRRDEVHNAEVNFIRQRLLSTGQLPWDLDCSVGVRYFRFQESLVFSSLADPARMSDANMDPWAILDEQITNNLIGLQFGFDANYYLGPNWRLFLAPKFGIYDNHINHVFRAQLGDGTVATQSEYPGQTYPVRSDLDAVSFLTQVDLGLEWQLTRKWSALVGYRVVAATGIGLADNQIPPYIVDLPEIAAIDTNGELVLHGAFFGLTYNF